MNSAPFTPLVWVIQKPASLPSSPSPTLRRMGAVVREFACLGIAEAALREPERPSVVVLDGHFGAEDCLQWSREFRRCGFDGLAILMVERAEPSLSIEARLGGIDAVLTMPLSDHTVNAILRAVSPGDISAMPASPRTAAA